MIHNEVVGAQIGEMKNFNFHQYSILMHLILFYNKEHVGFQFLEATDEFEVPLPIQIWSRCWNHFFPYSNSILFYNEFVCPIMMKLGVVVERVPRSIRKLLKPRKFHDDNLKPLEHDWRSLFLLEKATIIRISSCP